MIMLRRTKRFVRGFFPGPGRIWKYTFDPARSKTFYPQADRKGTGRVFLDQLWPRRGREKTSYVAMAAGKLGRLPVIGRVVKRRSR